MCPELRQPFSQLITGTYIVFLADISEDVYYSTMIISDQNLEIFFLVDKRLSVILSIILKKKAKNMRGIDQLHLYLYLYNFSFLFDGIRRCDFVGKQVKRDSSLTLCFLLYGASI